MRFEEPFADVTVGVVNALTVVGELAGRRFIDEQGNIIDFYRDR